MAELLLELLSEEIPARMQARAAEDLKRLVTDGLKAAGLSWTRADAFVTPRRLALVIDGLPVSTPDRVEEMKGPRVGAPDQAIQGFLRKLGGDRTLANCEKRSDGKSESWVFVQKIAGRATAEAASEAIAAAVRQFPWPNSMRWGAYRQSWVRPLQSLIGLFGSVPLRGDIDLGGATLRFGSMTTGHRFLAPAQFEVTSFAEYRDKLRAACVILDPVERRAEVERQAQAAAAGAGLVLKDDPGLLDEVTGLVEWPVAHVGTIDAAFMNLPGEVLSTSMRTHQRYFTLLNADGSTAPRFVVVANMKTDATGTANIITGNERVLRARLSDAKFFWDQDRKARLDSRVPALKERTFYAKLGTMEDKVVRLQALASDLELMIPGCTNAPRAAFLAKADLSTGMVGEFPELQGIMGRYYARADGESAVVAEAIREHYSPLGPNDRCPSAPVSIAVALADKLDTLVGFFAIGEKPTGSKDPFALRRAALGIIRLIVENKLRLSLGHVFAQSHQLYVNQLGAAVAGKAPVADLIVFFADRLKVALKEQGVRHDLIDAVFARGDEDDLVRLLMRVDALKAFLGGEDGANLLIAFRRGANIVAIEEKKDKTRHDGAVAPGDLVLAEEQALHAALDSAGPVVDAAIAREDFATAMSALARLRGPVDAFFDKVTVNDSDHKLRVNRLRLLSRIRATLGRVADFSRIEG